MKICEKTRKMQKNAISPNRIGQKLKYGLSHIGTFIIQELANGVFGAPKKVKKAGCLPLAPDQVCKGQKLTEVERKLVFEIVEIMERK